MVQYGNYLKSIAAGADYDAGPVTGHCPAPCPGYSFALARIALDRGVAPESFGLAGRGQIDVLTPLTAGLDADHTTPDSDRPPRMIGVVSLVVPGDSRAAPVRPTSRRPGIRLRRRRKAAIYHPPAPFNNDHVGVNGGTVTPASPACVRCVASV
ncbi:hypothetical protein GCM10010187_28000 [Actinomadura coerulea]|nr:hypothetical protein GCM10010187_28000 [Actinomadura coerulea]